MKIVKSSREYLMERGNNKIFNANSSIISNDKIIEFSGSLTKNTKRAYLNDIKQFYGINDFSELTIEMIKNVNVSTANQYVEDMLKKGYASSTINRKMQALSKFYKYLCRREVGIMEYNPFASDEGTARLKVKRYSNTRALTDEEVKKIMEVISQDRTIVGLRNKIIILLLATTGMRRSEIANLKIGQIGKNQGKDIIEFTGKGRKERFVVIAKSIKKYIDQYLELRGKTYMHRNDPVFVGHSTNSDPTKAITTETIYQLIKSVSKQAGLEDSSISPHCFRHTYITKSLELGCSLEDVQDRVGHADISTTRRYDHTRRMIEDNPADELANLYDI